MSAVFGTKGYPPKLTQADVQLIREAVAMRDFHKQEALKLSNAALAEKFGVSPTTISCIINNWYHYKTASDT